MFRDCRTAGGHPNAGNLNVSPRREPREVRTHARTLFGFCWPHPTSCTDTLWVFRLVFTVNKTNAYNYQKHLARGDVQILRESLRFTFRHSKTNRFGLREHVTVALAMPGKVLDPHQAVIRAFNLCPQSNGMGPAFAVPSAKRCETTPLIHNTFVNALRHCLNEIGVDPSKYSGHSFRRGGATFAHRLGVDPLLIKRMGDWRSDAYMRYIDHNTPEGRPGPPAANPRSGLLRLRVSAKVCGAWAAQAG
jgi:hypothetical protein